MTFHKEGIPSLIITIIVVASINFLTLHFCAAYPIVIWLGYALSAFLLITILQFFRNPTRTIHLNENNIIAPADGKVVVIEDLISTGKSSLQVCDVLKAAEVNVIGMVSIFTYGFAVADKAFEAAAIPYQSLTNYPTLIELAIEKGIVSPDQQKTLLNWSADPANWSGN